jgi:uncharacterized zinc-type alcohol dehydrogenase-like protein
MIATRGYAASRPQAALAPFTFQRREPGPTDVLIEILYCGVCHSDIHQARQEWGSARFPMVPGHEIVGRVSRLGSKVRKFKLGDLAGVGCLVNSCRTCASCQENQEQYCENGSVGTYNSLEKFTDSKGQRVPTYGGYSEHIVVDEDFTLRLPPQLPLAATAPLLCAGITTYSPLRHFQVRSGQKVGVVGLGGLGHMAVKFARALGCQTVVFTTSAHKRAEALRLGAHEAVLSTDEAALDKQARSFDFILDTVSAAHDLNWYLHALKRDGTLCLVGAPEDPHEVEGFELILQRRRLAGSLIGGIAETQEMLDYCGQHGITSDIELIPIQQINTAFDRVVAGDVQYRFVIDMGSLRQDSGGQPGK